MAPSRKSRSVNKRFSSVRETASSKDKITENASKNKLKASPGIQKKRRLADMLGPQWNKDELGHFYEAYRKFGKDWKKVALAVRNRSVEMVEALYTMNRAYLSLPEGTASVVGLIAMMTDHYSVLGGSDSGKESNDDAEISKRPQKRLRGKHLSDNKALDGHFSDHSQSHSVASGDGCLSLLKKRHSGIRPHAVRKRTPRVPISYSIGKDIGERFFSSARQGSKQMVDTNDVTHKIALALTEASQRGGSSKNSGSPDKKFLSSPGLKSGKKHSKSEKAGSKFCSSELDDGSSELSLGSTEGNNEDYSRKTIHRSGREITGRGRNEEKKIKQYGKNLEPEGNEGNLNKHLNDIKEASSGTDDGKNFIKSNFNTDFVDAKNARSSYKGSRTKSKKPLLEKDEGSAFDALKTLADLSLMLPVTNPDTESSAQFKEGNRDVVDESKMESHKVFPKIESTASSKFSKVFSDNGVVPEAEGTPHLSAGFRKRRQRFYLKNDETHTGSHLSGSQKTKPTDEVKKSLVKGKRSSVCTPHPRQLKVGKSPGNLSSSTNDKRERDDSFFSPIKVSSTNEVSPLDRGRPRRKMEKPKPMTQDLVASRTTFSSQHNKPIASLPDGSFSQKGKLINCLSSYQMRRWCTFEWFYSAIDYPWFSKREFVEYLDHVGLGHVPRLTRIEWGVIRSSLGRPRRFSEQFLTEEKHKLHEYRKSVRSHYAEILAGTKEGLPTDLAQPLIVGQRVIAIHPKTREIHDGSVLIVDHCRYRVQFDQPELGVEFVMDVDCMPLYPLENMPTSLIQHNTSSAQINENFVELKPNGKMKQRKVAGHTILSPGENSDTSKSLHISPTLHGPGALSKQVFSSSSKPQPKFVCSEIGNPQLPSSSQPSLLEHVHSKEADTLAISDLNRALDKKELILSELKHMNDGISESQKYGDNLVKDSELFKRNYASVLKQLTEANEQVSSALFCLRQRNTYQASSSVFSLKPMANFDDPSGQASSSNCSACHIQESISQSHIAEIVESSRRKARTMVVQASQAMSNLRTTERIEDAINFINNQLSVDEPTAASATTFPPADPFSLASQDQLAASVLNPLTSCHVQDAELNSSPDQNEMKIPSELISHCLATLFMIQKCTERQFPPADVAQVLDSAVTSLQPLCSKNIPIYGEIQKCMGIIRNQILALIPT
ncbi:protein ALWAYS EARLY 3 [Vigna unguiculata]|uniref:protein ALWAYS EARLY 3 n=1 Tax=Vigna unguiculata TaxID=3917 RepID=UPI001016D3C7|nr:protein ALWAYS EARLY 3 [Vigna unguiculata]XP_027918484.1 protein ALWAYS EARLY 3 [Vigna unguiculata]XP_027918485.1 protein ALWAYS EARLY 3 [Vigna unguiculata]XP_027918486.1 protein ALWAYS EARLY 3 [Vigna unguiculata]XP_027918487.1 protein ALWAYS EARLY 3 [Vigna unguiculata]XP_027918488.1 protein ALWAYS EARLY 3 [Vigna unguiculata]XP_027918489.1 protein ALWAYS EARLY 3 [Vigna unguiculata]XP_027918490.1 protein ALWAYS EARLY 3 [Vigna unguiculata]XP_027918491.1 protein ALWAYS EARLY 3 [Vigna unguic